MAEAQKSDDWNPVAVKLQKQILDLSAQCIAFKQVLGELVELYQDSQLASVIVGRFSEYYHDEMNRQFTILENTVGSALAADFDKDRTTPEMIIEA